jgi:predicted transcriptional regulator
MLIQVYINSNISKPFRMALVFAITKNMFSFFHLNKSGVSREMIGKYERGEAVPSIEALKKMLMLLRYLLIIS